MEITERYLKDVIAAAEAVDLHEVGRSIDLLARAYAEGQGVYVIGNGGSASNASHFAQDLAKGSVPDLRGQRFRVLSLADNIAYITAIANDMGYEDVFEIQLRQFASCGDVLVAISGSGKSPNIIRAVEYARRQSMTVIGVTGFDGGELRGLSDVQLHVPLDDMCQSEAVHSILLHMIADLLRSRFAEGSEH